MLQNCVNVHHKAGLEADVVAGSLLNIVQVQNKSQKRGQDTQSQQRQIEVSEVIQESKAMRTAKLKSRVQAHSTRTGNECRYKQCITISK